MTKIWANSGDSHFLEPPDLFATTLPSATAERLPRSVKDPDGRHETIYVDGQVIRRVIPSVARHRGADGMTQAERAIARTRGGSDVNVRLSDLDSEGIWAELIYPSLATWQFLIRDPQLALEGHRVVNDWAIENVQGKSSRLVVAAGIPMVSIEDAAGELRRCAEMGYKAVSLPIELPDGQEPYNSPAWEPLWAAAEEANVILAFHIATGNDSHAYYLGPGATLINYVELSFPGQRAIIMMVASGALDRHPNLKVVCSEAGASWVPFIGDRMNEAFRQHSGFVKPKLSATPKEILYRQVYASFQHDESAIAALTAQGYRNVMWGSDYPHVEGTYGHTQETLHQLFDPVDESVRQRITTGAFEELFPHVGRPPELSETQASPMSSQ